MSAIVVNLNIMPDEFLRLYQGSAKTVSVVAVDGRRVQFPAQILRPFVTRDGVRGRFMIKFDPNNRFDTIERLT